MFSLLSGTQALRFPYFPAHWSYVFPTFRNAGLTFSLLSGKPARRFPYFLNCRIYVFPTFWNTGHTFAHGKLTQTYIFCNVCVNLSCVCCNITFIAATLPTSAATSFQLLLLSLIQNLGSGMASESARFSFTSLLTGGTFRPDSARSLFGSLLPVK